jgi:Tfp pilus assembly protein PilO
MPAMTLSLSKPAMPQMPKSQTERLWLMVGGIAAVVILLAGWFLFISPQRSDTSSVNTQVHAAQDKNAVLRARIAQLKAQNANLAQYLAEVKQAKLALPDSSGLSDFLRTLQSIGSSTQTTMTALTVGSPTNLNGSVTTTAKPGSAATNPASNTGANGGLGPIYQMPITLSVSGSPSQLDEFLSQLQSVQPRAVLITQLNEAGASEVAGAGGRQTLGLTMQAFVAPSSAAENAQLAAGVKPSK